MANELIPGSQAVVYATKEATYGTPRKIVGTYAFRTISETFTPAEERIIRPDRTGSPDNLERVRGRGSATWEVQKLILPSGSVTTEPDDTELWENAFGHLSISATAIEYCMATAHTSSITLRRGIRTGGQAGTAEFQEHIMGAIANYVEIAWGDQGNNGLATVTFRGDGKRWGFTGNSSISAATTNLTVTHNGATVGSSKQFSYGSLIKIGTDTAGGSGILITTANYTNNSLVWAETLSASHSGGNVIKPYNPTETTGGSPIHARLGFLSLDGSSSEIDHLGGRVTFQDNRGLLNEEVGYDSPSRVQRTDRRSVTFNLRFLMKKEQVPTLLADMARDTAKNIQVNIGDQSYKTIKLIMRNGRFDMNALDVGQNMVQVAMAGVALGTNGNDSLKVRYQ